MQLIETHLSHFNFFCPATGKQVLGDDLFEPSPATEGVWISEMIEEPQHLSDEIEPAWTSYVAKSYEEDDWLDLPALLRDMDQPTWVAFAITTSGMACGPVNSTVYVVVDMDYEADSENAEDK